MKNFALIFALALATTPAFAPRWWDMEVTMGAEFTPDAVSVCMVEGYGYRHVYRGGGYGYGYNGYNGYYPY